MDRLPTLIAVGAALAAVGCKGGEQRSESRERVNAVKVSAKDRPDPAAMCDRHYTAGAAPSFSLPELAVPAPAKRAGAWRWINVWATWCKPCIRELPRLVSWRSKLVASQVNVDLVLVSADESDEAIATFRKAHPNTPAGGRLREPDGVAAWIEKLGVKGATLPVHVFVDPNGKTRCVRASEVQESDYAAIAALLGAK